MLFSTFEPRPHASGSIAQVHEARLSRVGAALAGCHAGARVAVKVAHPGVATNMLLDMKLLEAAAAGASQLPMLKELRLEDSVR